MTASYILQDRAELKMTSSRNEKVDGNFVQPAATRLDATASKDEQIKVLLSSVQDLEQQLAYMSARFKTLEDGLDVTRSELNATTITRRQMKDELAEQSEEQFKAFEKLLSSSSHGLNEELITNIPAIVTNVQNSEKMKNILEEVTTIKEELAQEVIATQQNLESTTQMFEKEFTTIKEEIQACCSEAKKAEDNYAQSLTSIQAKLTASQVVGQHEEGKASRKLTQQIENLKRNLTEHFNQKFTCTEGDVTEFREEMKKLHEELEVVKQKNSLQAAALATSHNKMKRNLILFVVIVIFAGVLAAFFSPYSMVYDVNQTTLNIVNDLRARYDYKIVTMRTYWSLTVDQMKNDQELHLQRLDDIERDVTLMNQLKDSNHYIISRNLTDSPSPTAMYIGRWKYEYPVEQLLKLTPTCQYVVYDSLFLSIGYHINNEEDNKRRYDNTEQCIEHWFKSPFFPGVSCEDIYNKNPESHQCSGYYWIVKSSKVFCGMTYTGSSCEHIYNKYPEIYKNNPKEKSGYYHLSNKQWTYCNMTEIAANNDEFTSTCAAVEVIKSTYQSFLPGESCTCESIYDDNAESHEWSGYYWITSSRVYCGMNYTGLFYEDIYKNNPETGDKSGYYRTNYNQWTYCNMSAVLNGDFISTCAGVGGGW